MTTNYLVSNLCPSNVLVSFEITNYLALALALAGTLALHLALALALTPIDEKSVII